jgi:hypothetical protein
MHQPAYPNHPPSGAVPARTNGLAVASFVLGLCGLAILPVVLGHVALRQIRTRGDGGTGFAVAGLVLGYLVLVASALLVAVVVGLGVWGVTR